MRFWVNEDTAEASLSLKLSDITSIERLSPLDSGSTGPEGIPRFDWSGDIFAVQCLV